MGNLMKNARKYRKFLLPFVRNSCIMALKYRRYHLDGRRQRLGEVIAVVSGKGGTGKTSVCAGLAGALAEAGHRVLCIDCDVGLRNLDISLGMAEQDALSFLDVCQGHYTLSQAAVSPWWGTLSLLTAPMNCQEIPQASFQDLLRQARKERDYILLDAPAGVGPLFRLAAGASDRVLLVTGSGPAAVRDATRVGELLELMGKQEVRLVVNRVDREQLACLRLTIDDVMDEAGLPLAGIVPEDPNVVLAASFGKPVGKFARRTAAVKAYRRIAQRLQGFHRPIPQGSL